MGERQDADAQLVVEERFAIVPEWLLDADVGDCAVRLYAVLLRYGNTSGARMPGRATLARRLRKKSTDTVDRAMRELVAMGAVRVEHRYAGRQRLTNRYHVQTSRPGCPDQSADVSPEGGRTGAATRGRQTGCDRNDATTGGRVYAAGVAAPIVQDPEHLTHSTNPHHPSRAWTGRSQELLAACGIEDWPEFVEEIQSLRRQVGGALGRWHAQHLLAAIELSVRARGWPAPAVRRALLQVAADPVTRSPARLAEAGPWWDEPAQAAGEDLDGLIADLDAADGRRVLLQRQARAQLEAEGRPVTRASVLRRAHALLTERLTGAAS